ncbi:MAG: NADH-quinone oxidoreductase subunit N [Bacteroidaceae bacterium]|nr:NADH-quinone oxidoreductase subunit N [Bacteroidaceae bacterium]
MDYSQFLNMAPELSLLAVILIIFVADLFMCTDRKSGRGVLNTPLPVILLSLHTLFCLLPLIPQFSIFNSQFSTAFGGMYVSSAMAIVVKTILNVGTIIVFLTAHEWLKQPEMSNKQGEYYLLTLFTLLGMYFMISAGHFLMFFIGLELASVPMTALIAYSKRSQESAEAAAKYILTALFSSGLMLYGISLIYGTTGTLYFDQIQSSMLNAACAASPNLLSQGSIVNIAALVLFIGGIGFKISLVPFHLWTADAYQGAPTAVTSYLSVISKGAAAFVLFVVLYKVFAPMIDQANLIFFWIIIFSITLANIFAVRQNNLKRFMAFSAISQAGYLVLGVMGATPQGLTAIVYYLLVYMAANLGVFLIISITEQRSGKLLISDYDGYYRTNPKLAFLMTLCLFSLAGIPPFAGFFSKFFMFMAAFKAGFVVLVLIALVNTVISLYYYLLIVKAMYIKPNEQPIATFKSDGYTRVGLALCIVGVVLIGIISWFYTYIDQFAFGL